MLTALFELDTTHTFILFVNQPIEDLSRFAHVEVVNVGASRPTTEAAVADSSRSPLDMYRLYRAVAAQVSDSKPEEDSTFQQMRKCYYT